MFPSWSHLLGGVHIILWFVFNANQRHGLVLLSNTDFSNVFYQLRLTPSGDLKLAVPFPSNPNYPKLVAIPTFWWVGLICLMPSHPPQKPLPIFQMSSLDALHISLHITRSNMQPPLVFLSDLLLLMPSPSTRQALFNHLWPMLKFTWKILSNLHKDGSIICQFVAWPFVQYIESFNLMFSTIPDGGSPSQWTNFSRAMMVSQLINSSLGGSLTLPLEP